MIPPVDAVLMLDVHDLDAGPIDLVRDLDITVRVFHVYLIANASLIVMQVVIVHLTVIVQRDDHRQTGWIDLIVGVDDVVGERPDSALARRIARHERDARSRTRGAGGHQNVRILHAEPPPSVPVSTVAGRRKREQRGPIGLLTLCVRKRNLTVASFLANFALRFAC